MIYIIIGVCGSGKTTIGKALSEKLDIAFVDADDLHTAVNKGKMSNGIPLTDEDRHPWLLNIHQVIESWQSQGKNGVITCSALKKSYRDILLYGNTELYVDTSETTFVYLKGDMKTIQERMKHRQHFMPATLLPTQLDVLEEPQMSEAVVEVDIRWTVDNIVKYILDKTQL